MNPAEHLAVFISIILGLAVADLLNSVSSLVRARGRVRFHWLPAAWAFGLFGATLQLWWALFSVLQVEIWKDNAFAFLFLVLLPVTLYLAASAILPEVGAESSLDLEAYYYQERTWFFLLLALLVVLSVTSELLRGAAFLTPARPIHAALFLLFLSLAWSRNRRFHAAAVVLVYLLYAVFITLFTLRLG